jgi:phage shock protein A
MALLERVTTLIKANLNDLVEKAEHPEKLLKQLLLDMENQLMQVKTQVAIAIAEHHLLEKRRKDNLQAQQEWIHKAELALAENNDGLARIALDRSLTYDTAARNFEQQIEDQSHQVDMLKSALQRLEQKMAETRAKAEVIAVRYRRAKLAQQAGMAGIGGFSDEQRLANLNERVNESEALGEGYLEALQESGEKKLEQLERLERVNTLLAELKARKAAGQPA